MQKIKNWIIIILVLALAAFGGFFAVPGKLAKKAEIPVPNFLEKPFKLGLDLQGGVHLLYQADLSGVEEKDWQDSVEGLRDIIERRVDLFGVEEPIVQIQKTDGGYRLIVELAGVIDPDQAIEMIGETPYLEFKEEMSEEEKMNIINGLPAEEINKMIEMVKKEVGDSEKKIIKEDLPRYLPLWNSTELTGKYLKKAKIQLDQTTFNPFVSIEFDSEGAKLFEELTRKNWHKPLAIFIDGRLISSPIIVPDDPAETGSIKGGKAQISGNFTVNEAKDLARNLNAGALPIPIELISQQSVGPSLGEASIRESLFAGVIGFLFIILFMVLIYRFSGILAAISLLIYTIILLSLFKLIPVTLTLAGIAGFVLSLGMAVDANILIFERLKEEIQNRRGIGRCKAGEELEDVKQSVELQQRDIDNAFFRAWTAIRDGNLTTLIICVILFLIASGFVQGFALTLGVGILVSMFTAMVITKLFIKTFGATRLRKLEKIWTR